MFPLSSHRTRTLYRIESPNPPGNALTTADTIKETHCITHFLNMFLRLLVTRILFESYVNFYKEVGKYYFGLHRMSSGGKLLSHLVRCDILLQYFKVSLLII